MVYGPYFSMQNIKSSLQEVSTATELETTTDDDREKEVGERGPRPGRKRKRRKKRRDRMRKVSVDESVFDPSNSIKRGDIIEYTVKEDKV